MTSREAHHTRSARRAGVVLGVGLGGFVDGIVLHQLLQWHHMISDTDRDPATLTGLEANTVADGVFHAVAWLCVLAGVVMLRRASASAPTSNELWADLLIGWGAFNLVEGLVDHHLLGLHHVREDVSNPGVWDLAFLAFGALLMLLGALLRRRSFAAQTPA